jgi:hypothetical protein
VEPFNADLYVRTVFAEKIVDVVNQAEALKQEAVQKGEPFTDEDSKEMDRIVEGLRTMDGEGISAQDIKKSKILSKTKMYKDFDNVRRTRAVIEAQMRKLVDTLNKRQGEIGKPFFTFASSVEEYKQQAAELQQEMGLEVKAA